MAIAGTVGDLMRYSRRSGASDVPDRQQLQSVRHFLTGYLQRCSELGISVKEAAEQLRMCRTVLEQHALEKKAQSGWRLPTLKDIRNAALLPIGAATALGLIIGYPLGSMIGNMVDYPEDVGEDVAARELISTYKRQIKQLEQGRKLTF